MQRLVILLTALALVSASAERTGRTNLIAAVQSARPIRALYVTGGGFHAFGKQEAIVPPAVARHANGVWTIDHTVGHPNDAGTPAEGYGRR